ncbi:hypothetical protein Tco_0379541 [Tanacetum coccineum]
MGDENPIRTLGDYSKPSHKGYRNTIELPEGNNVVPLRSDTIWFVQNGCSFHRLRSEDPNQHLKDFLKLVDLLDLDGSISTWEDFATRFLAQFFPSGRTVKLRNDILMRTIDQSAGSKLRDLNAEESWALLEDLALYDNESWNDPRDFDKLVKAIALPQDVPSTSDRCPNGRSGGRFEGRFGKHYGGNGGIGGFMSRVGEGKDESIGGMGGGSLADVNGSNDGMGWWRIVLRVEDPREIGAGGGEVNDGGVDLGVSKRLLLLLVGDSCGIEVLEVGVVDGGLET